MADKSEQIDSIAMSKGFFYPAAEIYGATAGFWTYGHLGTKIKRKWENLWRETFLGLNPNYFEIDDCHIMPKKVFESSGHLEHFNDPLVECKKCNQRMRADTLVEDALKIEADGLDEKALSKLIKENKLVCTKCSGKLDEVKWFNMMFDLKVGVMGDTTMYLRPESAQSSYLAFKREYEALRKKLPLGLATIGKAYRNEISPRQGFFRSREFTQAELQIFFNPNKINEAENWDEIKSKRIRVRFSGEDKVKKITANTLNTKHKIPKFYVYHMANIQEFYLEKLNVSEGKFRFRELNEQERAFYNKIHFDIEGNLDLLGGWKELGGLHYRGDHDLGGHSKGAKTKMEVVTPDGERFIPHVLELSFGVDRNVFAMLDLFYKEDKERNWFEFPSTVVPIEVAIFPLVNKNNLPEKAMEVYNDLQKEFEVFYDTSGSIGRRYRRQDEVGTLYCITIDHQSLEDDTVTVRNRDSMEQHRVKIKKLSGELKKLMQ